MGTNYYIKYKASDSIWKKILHIGKQKTLHIGKQSAGWKFLFQGHIDMLHPKIESVKDLKLFIKNNHCLLFNEYQDKIKFKDFFENVDKRQNADNDAVEKSKYNNYWHDNDGYSFCSAKFS